MSEDLAPILLRIARRLDDIHAELQARRPDRRDAKVAELVRAIRAHAQDRAFSSAELIAHCQLPAAQALREAIVAAVGELNTRALGKLLKKWEGVDLGGASIQRIGNDRDGAVWRASLRECKPAYPHFA